MIPISRAGHWKDKGFRLQATGFRLQASGFRLQATGYRLKSLSLRLAACSWQRGFTLIELIIVSIVLAAVLTIAFPRMEAFFSGSYLKSTSRRLVGTIRYLHDRSATTGKRYHLCYNLDENEYWIEEENEEGGFEEMKTVLGRRETLPEGIIFLDIITPEGKINSGQTLTLFFPKGYVTKSIIHLQNEKEEVQTLLVKGTMGQVVVYEGYIEEEE